MDSHRRLSSKVSVYPQVRWQLAIVIAIGHFFDRSFKLGAIESVGRTQAAAA
jgi:hypothetical protein